MSDSDQDRFDKKNSLQLLKTKVLERGLCVGCGACVGLCPHLIVHEGRVAAPDPCGLEEGLCAKVCPVLDGVAVAQYLTRTEGPLEDEGSGPVGFFMDAWRVRAPQLKDMVQYGGTVSALAIHLLEKGQVEGVVMTGGADGAAPHGRLARNREDVLSCGGSRYSPGACLALFNQERAGNPEKPLAVVGLPCQASAARLLFRHGGAENQTFGPPFVIGLFCTWNLSWRNLLGLLSTRGVNGQVQRFDVPPPPAEVFQVHTARETIDIPLSEVRGRTLPGCALCMDMTAEAADISVGACEGFPEWNTVLVRSEVGRSLIREALEHGLLEALPIHIEGLDHLMRASEGKRKRALKRLEEVDDA